MARDKNGRFMGTYRATLASLVAAAGTSAFFVISGKADRKILIKQIKISGLSLTAVAYLRVNVGKHSVAFTGGTPSVATKVPVSSRYPASEATLVQGYTAAPSGGSLIGNIASRTVLGQATTAAAGGLPIEQTFIFDEGDEPALLTAAESLSLSFNAAPASAVTLSVEVVWDEEY